MPTASELKEQLKTLKKSHPEIRYSGLKKPELVQLVQKYTTTKQTPAPAPAPAPASAPTPTPKKESNHPTTLKTQKEQLNFIKRLLKKYFNKPKKYVLPKFAKDSGDEYPDSKNEDRWTLWVINNPVLVKDADYSNSGYDDFHYRIFDTESRFTWDYDSGDWKDDLMKSLKSTFK